MNLGNIRRRLDRLEAKKPDRHIGAMWSVLLGDPYDPADLDPAFREVLDALPDGPIEDSVETQIAGIGRPPDGLSHELPCPDMTVHFPDKGDQQ